MFVRVQKVRQAGRVYEYVHIVEGYRDADSKVRHRVVANLGRRDRLKDSGALDNLAAAFTRLDPEPGSYLCGALPLVAPVLERLDLRSEERRVGKESRCREATQKTAYEMIW